MQHHTGMVLRELMRRTVASGVSIDNPQQNGIDGVHQARVRLSGDPVTYRLVLAPASAPIMIYGSLIGAVFEKPLGDG